MATPAATVLARPGEHITALGELMSELLKQEQVYRTIIEMITSVDVRYEMDVGDGDRHPPLGHWAPDLSLATQPARRVSRGSCTLAELFCYLADQMPLRKAPSGSSDRVEVVALHPR